MMGDKLLSILCQSERARKNRDVVVAVEVIKGDLPSAFEGRELQSKIGIDGETSGFVGFL